MSSTKHKQRPPKSDGSALATSPNQTVRGHGTSPYACLRAKGLLARQASPCLELRTQLLGAEFCAALSQHCAEQLNTAGVLPRDGRGTPPPKVGVSGKALQATVAQRAAGRAILKPMLADLCAHYGQHTWNRAAAKPLGPSFRSRHNCEIGAHEGRAWRLWKRAAVARRWCRRCGSFFREGVTTTTVVTNEKLSEARRRRSALKAKKVRKKTATVTAKVRGRAKRRVCLRCFTTGMRKATRFERQREKRIATSNEVALLRLANSSEHHHRIPDLAQMESRQRSLLQPTYDATLRALTVTAIAKASSIKRARRRKRKLSAVKQARRQRSLAKKRKAVTASVTSKEEQRRVVKQVLLAAVPRGPIARGKRPPPPALAPSKPTAVPPSPSPSPTPVPTTVASVVGEPPRRQGTAEVLSQKTRHEPEEAPRPLRKADPPAPEKANHAAKEPGASEKHKKASQASPPSLPSSPTEKRASAPARSLAAPSNPGASSLSAPLVKPGPMSLAKKIPPGPLRKKAPRTPTSKTGAATGKKKVMDVMSKLGF